MPADLSSKAAVELESGVPFISDADLEAALKDAGVSSATTAAVVDENAKARLDGLRASLSVLAVLALIALFLSRSIPTTPVGAEGSTDDVGAADRSRSRARPRLAHGQAGNGQVYPFWCSMPMRNGTAAVPLQ